MISSQKVCASSASSSTAKKNQTLYLVELQQAIESSVTKNPTHPSRSSNMAGSSGNRMNEVGNSPPPTDQSLLLITG